MKRAKKVVCEDIEKLQCVRHDTYWIFSDVCNLYSSVAESELRPLS